MSPRFTLSCHRDKPESFPGKCRSRGVDLPPDTLPPALGSGLRVCSSVAAPQLVKRLPLPRPSLRGNNGDEGQASQTPPRRTSFSLSDPLAVEVRTGLRAPCPQGGRGAVTHVEGNMPGAARSRGGPLGRGAQRARSSPALPTRSTHGGLRRLQIHNFAARCRVAVAVNVRFL